MMLSRVAQRIYWLTRYLERAENSARLILVRHQAILDLPRDIQPDWDLLLHVLGAREHFAKLPGAATEKNIISFVFGERSNPSSIISSLAHARENMRTTREILPSEAWERVNSLYLSVARRSNKDLPRASRHSVLNNIIQCCQQISGLLSGTMNKDAAYQFIELGRNVERADMSTRIIDFASADLGVAGEDALPFQNVLWISVLQSLSAYQMYRINVQRNVSPADTLEFLLQNKVFPRSVAHCLVEIEKSMQLLPHSKEALQVVASLQRKIRRSDFKTLEGEKLHEFLDLMQQRLSDINQAIYATWFSPGQE